MNHFVHALVQPTAVLMLFVILFAISAQVYPSFKRTDGTTTLWVWPILWVILAIVAFVAWISLIIA